MNIQLIMSLEIFFFFFFMNIQLIMSLEIFFSFLFFSFLLSLKRKLPSTTRAVDCQVLWRKRSTNKVGFSYTRLVNVGIHWFSDFDDQHFSLSGSETGGRKWASCNILGAVCLTLWLTICEEKSKSQKRLIFSGFHSLKKLNLQWLK